MVVKVNAIPFPVRVGCFRVECEEVRADLGTHFRQQSCEAGS